MQQFGALRAEHNSENILKNAPFFQSILETSSLACWNRPVPFRFNAFETHPVDQASKITFKSFSSVFYSINLSKILLKIDKDDNEIHP